MENSLDKNAMTVINSLSEYVSFLEANSWGNFLYRGERPDDKGDEHPERRTGAFRKSNNGFHSNFITTINEYYSEVGHRISDYEKQEFLAFSQHHGLMTNLLDVTTNPLVALFFACYGAKNEENSHIYIFDTLNYIDVSDILYAIPPLENFMELLKSGDYFVLQKMQTAIKAYFRKHRKIGMFENGAFVLKGLGHINNIMFNLYTYTREIYRKNSTNEERLNMPTTTVKELFCSCSRQALGGHISGDTIDGEQYYKELIEALLNEPEFKGFNITTPHHQDISLYYSLFLYYCISISYPNIDSEVFKFFLPPMIYKPRVKFDRLKNQQGYFIYQPYSYYFNQDITKSFQTINANYTLKINNVYEIMKGLDALNINIATMYNDYDSIARYTQHKNEKGRQTL